MHYTFQYRILRQEDWVWHSKSRTWKTLAGAQKAADTWCTDMVAEDCPVNCRVGKIVDGRFVSLDNRFPSLD